ncbi:MAG: CCA tRNA nucleotidyltransferase [Candidatus Aenigmatarchaeota archaeon]|nr:MAG: CCA tRNA nucleotidyltransferase [Candidatus Aenigmarchaeota archaeon]
MRIKAGDRVNDVLNSVLRKVAPTAEERKEVLKLHRNVLHTAEIVCEGLRVKPMMCGSIAKDTWLKGHKDFDLFLRFRESTSRENLEEYGLKLGKEIINRLGGTYEIAYAEHPYIRGFFNGHRIDIVPAFDVRNPGRIKSAVDRTPYHVRYVNQNLDRGLVNEVRLLKQFCKGIGVYGSNLKVRGFSGYLCELLIIKYIKFRNLVEDAADWWPGKVIDIEGFYRSEKYLREKKFPGDALIVVDPVDRNRNVASVLSSENFIWFVKKCQEFVEEPNEDIFFGKPRYEMTLRGIAEKLRERGTEFLMIYFAAPEEVHRDILWPQMRKLLKRIEDVLKDGGFRPLRSDIWSDETNCILIFEMEVDELPAVKEVLGPSIFDRKNSEGFLKKYRGKKIFLQENRWVAETEREFRRAIELIRDFLSGDEDELRGRGVPKDLARVISEDVAVADRVHCFRFFRRYPGLRSYMNEYFHRSLG